MDINDGRQTARIRQCGSGKVTLRQPSEREAIRTVFLHRVESYALGEVSRLTGIPADSLRRAARKGDRDAYKAGGAWRFTWRQAVNITLQRWTLAEVHEALGDDAATVLPPLLTLRAVTVQLPEYVLRALETLATDERTTLDAFLYSELIDFAGAVCTRMGERIDGYRRAYLFPGLE